MGPDRGYRFQRVAGTCSGAIVGALVADEEQPGSDVAAYGDRFRRGEEPRS